MLPFVGVGFEFIANFQGLMVRFREKHGPIFTVLNFGQRMTFVTDMRSIRKIWTLPQLFDFEEFGLAAEARLAGMSYPEVVAAGVASPTLAIHAHEMRSPQRLEELAVRFRTALDTLFEVPMFAKAASNVEWQACDLMDPFWCAGVVCSREVAIRRVLV